MSQITMAEAVIIRSQISKKINELLHERNGVQTEIIDKGQTAEVPQRNVDFITQEIRQVRDDHRLLSFLMSESNVKTTIDWDGQAYAVVEAIELAKQMRQEAGELKALGNRKKMDRSRNVYPFGNNSGSTDTFVVALYDPEEYKKHGDRLERQVTALSFLIDKANLEATIQFDASDYVG